MNKYFRSLGYYTLAIFDSFINFIASIIGFYPIVDYASSFLVFLEMRKVHSVLGNTQKRRDGLETKADKNLQEAKDMLDG
tara:strand:- start:240 stop:479 length:240 start_codon:yes stop_codon:yes gene_type:complete